MRIKSIILLTAVYLLGTTEGVLSQNNAVDKKYVKGITELSKKDNVKSALDYIYKIDDKTTQDLILLTEIPAPPFKEEKRAAKYAEMLKEAGADSVWIDEVGNVLALRKGTKGNKTVALDAHIDTVFPEETDVTVKMRGDTLYAPGIGDDTRGLVVVLTVLRALEASNIETEDDVLFIGTVGEEGLGDLRGVKHIFREGGPKIDQWIAVDGGGLNRVINKGLGSYRYRVTFKGPGGHSWGSFGYVNPAHALSRAVNHFSIEADKFTSDGPRTSFNIGRIGGGTSVNSVPFEAWMEVDMRSVSPESLNKIDAILKRAIQKGVDEENAFRRSGAPLTVDIDMIGNRPSGEIADNDPLVQNAMATTVFLGGEPSLGRSSTDSNIPISLGIPSVTIGRGGVGAHGHSLHEWWLNKDGHLAIQRALLLLLSQTGVAN
ncbi:M20/M25/M40 family metallo-hydrolase [Balneola vulgaris]|uniref:M20/M25/M40 family metallo-hydrolase n=1 Tax=Balneola vulgaris TaxID=287535 RepID=UPI000370FF24|nr:M20/M25/M40 family metallo-hydrolase [Balneola vulgaris]